MSDDIFRGLGVVERGLDYHLLRQKLLGSNVANTQTPNYRPKDLSFDSSLAEEVRLARTQPGHIEGPAGPANPNWRTFEDVFGVPNNDGNAVSLERELGKMGANSVRYRALAEMISRQLGLLRYATSDGQRR